MLLLLHCSLQKGASSDVDWHDIMEQAAAAGTDADLLQLAVNCNNGIVASAVTAASCAEHLEADVACRLMLTAAVRQHVYAVWRLASSEVCKRQVDATTLEKLFHLMLHSLHYTGVLCDMPAAAQLSSEQVAQCCRRLCKAITACASSCRFCCLR
jgi:hypothetical protein